MSAILLKHPTFEGSFFMFSWAKKVQKLDFRANCRVRTKKLLLWEKVQLWKCPYFGQNRLNIFAINCRWERISSWFTVLDTNLCHQDLTSASDNVMSPSPSTAQLCTATAVNTAPRHQRTFFNHCVCRYKLIASKEWQRIT